MPRIQPAWQGLLAAAVTVAVAALLPDEARLDLFALLLAATAGIYLGFAFLDGRRKEQTVEILVGLAFLAVALIGAQDRPLVLAAGWLAHIAWDLAHHPHKGVQTRIARWVPPFCLVYDLAIAVAIVAWVALSA